jgi:hypothetical protein
MSGVTKRQMKPERDWLQLLRDASGIRDISDDKSRHLDSAPGVPT